MMATVDFGSYYRVDGYGGIAWHLVGWEKTWSEPEAELWCEDDHDHDDGCYDWSESEEIECHDRVVAVMVGDDTRHLIDVEDLVPIAREDFCGECGQIGCTHDGLDR